MMKNKIKPLLEKVFKKQFVSLAAIVLALSLIGGYSVFAIAEKLNVSDETNNSQSNEAKSNNENIKEQIDSIFDNMNADKQETVYVIANADGSVKKIIVSELLKNPDGKKELSDESDLQDIENVKNNNTYKMSGESYVWDAEGEDVYYQGTTDKALPVDLSIDFTLDGKAISTDELAGKSGKLKMTFNYTNNEYEKVTIDGKTVKIYAPFAMLSGLALDNDKCKNIEVSNGRVISDGDRSIAVVLKKIVLNKCKRAIVPLPIALLLCCDLGSGKLSAYAPAFGCMPAIKHMPSVRSQIRRNGAKNA